MFGKMFIIIFLVNYLSYFNPIGANYDNLWIWKCSSGFCTRFLKSESETDGTYPSIEVCRLVCGEFGALWPKPRLSTKLGKELLQFHPSGINIEFNAVGEAYYFLTNVVEYFNEIISKEKVNNCLETTNKIKVNINLDSSNIDSYFYNNEYYELNVTGDGVDTIIQIGAVNAFGARHALETLLQLIASYLNEDGSHCLAIIKNAKIVDQPTYQHRGLLLDTSRNFLSIPVIKRNIDAMAASKLNILHWHITDSHSFPLELPQLPNMTIFGAYSQKKIYHPEDVKDLIEYAKFRGITVLLEIDAPSHAGNGWQWGPEAGLGNLSLCVNQEPYRSYCIQPPCGQLNPINPNVYDILGKIYSDIKNIVPASQEIFHMGGDEVSIPCWNSSQEILDYFRNHSKLGTEEDFLDLWSIYQEKAINSFDRAINTDQQTQIILWSSHLTNPEVIEKYLAKDRYIIQTWVPSDDDLPEKLLNLGYKLIISTKDKWYLDHGFWGTTTYHNWRNVYNNKIPYQPDVIGGEVCMWGEYVDDSSVESRVWPRAAAAAERLWSNPKTKSDLAEQRFYRHRERLVRRGINAEALTPKWCYQNEGACT